MKLQRLLSYTRRAVDMYEMIQPGDKIAIGISGGKDSLAMLYALSHLQRFHPHQFQLEAITVSLGFEPYDLSAVALLCKELDVPYTVVSTQIGKIVFEERHESNPCSLCAKMRKGALNDKALELGCNKVAYGHHKEDLVETMLLSLFFEGRFNTFAPVTFLERTELSIIRPLMFVPEKEIKGFTRLYTTPVIESSCPANGITKRSDMKLLIKQLNQQIPGVSDRMFHAIVNSRLDGWN